MTVCGLLLERLHIQASRDSLVLYSCVYLPEQKEKAGINSSYMLLGPEQHADI